MRHEKAGDSFIDREFVESYRLDNYDGVFKCDEAEVMDAKFLPLEKVVFPPWLIALEELPLTVNVLPAVLNIMRTARFPILGLSVSTDQGVGHGEP